MHKTWRVMMIMIVTAALWVAAEAGKLAAQYPPVLPPPPKPAETTNPAEIHAKSQASTVAKRALLQQNEKEFREGVERLYRLSGELREEVQKTPTSDVLSVRMMKKADEIEKLAKVLKNKAKGG
jgi:hypothetical protein